MRPTNEKGRRIDKPHKRRRGCASCGTTKRPSWCRRCGRPHSGSYRKAS